MTAESKPTESKPTGSSPYLRFSIRSLLLLILLTAAFSAGWVAHRAWNRRNLQQTISDAIEKVGGPTQVEQMDDLGVMVIRGKKDDVKKMQDAVQEIETAAKK